MRLLAALSSVVLVVGLSGCLRKPKTPPPAPTPAPVAKPAPAPAPEPLSIPQTNVHLPPPQPLTPEAIATTQVPGTPPPPPPPVTRPQTTRPRPRPAEPPPVAVPTPAPPPNVEAGRGPFTEVLPPAELKRLQDETARSASEAQRLIRQLPASRRRQDNVRRIETFLKQAEDAERRGAMREASELAGRALVLARELRP